MISVHTEPNGWPYKYEQMPKVGHIIVSGDGRRGQVIGIEHRQPKVHVGCPSHECVATLVIKELRRSLPTDSGD